MAIYSNLSNTDLNKNYSIDNQIGSVVNSLNNGITNMLGGSSDAGVNVGDVISGWFGGTRKDEKMYDWKAKREWELNKAYEMSKYDWQKRGLINAGINPLIAMSSGNYSQPTINRSSESVSNKNGSSIISLIGSLLASIL